MAMPKTEGRFTHHALFIRDLSFFVHLGWSPEERRSLQEVRISIELRFRAAPRATNTDKLDDTICYDAINKALSQHFFSKEYALIEKVAADAYEVVGRLCGEQAQVGIQALKVNPPIDTLRNGVVYSCGDFSA